MVELMIERLGVSDDELPKQESGHHNALADAWHNKLISDALIVERLKRER